MGQVNKSVAFIDPLPVDTVRSRPLMLVVRDSSCMGADFEEDLPQGRAVLVDFSDLTQETLLHHDPSMIVSTIIGSSFDCVDVARTLADADYLGCYRIVSGPLPRPEVVLHEMRGSFPSLDIDLIAIDLEKDLERA